MNIFYVILSLIFLVLLGASNGIIDGSRIFFGLVGFILPGYLWTYLLLKNEGLNSVRRLIIGLGFSSVMLPIFMFAMNLVGIKLSGLNLMLLITNICALAGILLWLKDRDINDKVTHAEVVSLRAWSIIALIGVIILGLKVYLAARGNGYLLQGFDSSRVLRYINETVESGIVSHFYAPRTGLFYLGAGIRTLTGLSSVYGLFVPLVLYMFGGAGFTYLLAREISGSERVGLMAFLFFAIATVAPWVHAASFYGFVAAPLFWFLVIRYAKKTGHWAALFLAALGAFYAYPPLGFVMIITAGLPFFIEICKSIHAEEKKKEIMHSAVYFLILPLVVGVAFLMSNPMVLESYRGFDNFLNRSFGFWYFEGDVSILSTLIWILLVLHLVIVSVPLWGKTGFKYVKFLVKYGEKAKEFLARVLSTLVNQKVVGIFPVFFALYMMVALWVLYLDNLFWGGDTLGLFLILAVGALIMEINGKSVKYPKKWYFFAPLLFLPFGLLPASWVVGDLFIGDKPLYGIASVIYALGAMMIFDATGRLNSIKSKWGTVVIAMVVMSSLMGSINATATRYSDQVSGDFVDAMRWFEINRKGLQDIFVVSADYFSSDIDANDETFYTLNFVSSKIPLKAMVFVNNENLVINDFDKFSEILSETDAKIIFLEKTFDDEYLNKKIENLGSVIFESETTRIIEL